MSDNPKFFMLINEKRHNRAVKKISSSML